MAEEEKKESRGRREALYGKKEATAKQPEKETEGDVSGENEGGEHKEAEAPDIEARQATERTDMDSRHEKERMALHGAHRDEHRAMYKAHAAEYKGMANG